MPHAGGWDCKHETNGVATMLRRKPRQPENLGPKSIVPLYRTVVSNSNVVAWLHDCVYFVVPFVKRRLSMSSALLVPARLRGSGSWSITNSAACMQMYRGCEPAGRKSPNTLDTWCGIAKMLAAVPQLRSPVSQQMVGANSTVPPTVTRLSSFDTSVHPEAFVCGERRSTLSTCC